MSANPEEVTSKQSIFREGYMNPEQTVEFIRAYLSNSGMERPRSFVVEELAKSIAEFDDLYRLLAQ
jgi:hypothetical protein